jgi:hypothetical protein
MRYPIMNLGQIAPSITTPPVGYEPSEYEKALQACDQIPENRLVDRYNCQTQAFRKRLETPFPTLRQPNQTSPSAPATAPGTTGEEAPPTEQPGEVTVAVPRQMPAYVPPVLPQGPSQTLISSLETRGGVPPGLPPTPGPMVCGMDEFYDGAQCRKRAPVASEDIAGRALKPWSSSVTASASHAGGGGGGAPGACPPGQFWDGARCRGSIATGAGGLISAAAGGGLGPSGAMPFTMKGIQQVRLSPEYFRLRGKGLV